ncbi:MAG: STT3 domain-containing protein [Candidatus Bathyarchaeia archaeon]
MGIRKALSKESIVNGIKSLGKLRIKISHSSIMVISALMLILFVAFTIRILPLRWEIAPEKSTLLLSEFDPYYQYSLAKYMVENGLFAPYMPPGWIDHQRWYPDGINMAQSYPSLPMTAAFLYNIVSMLGVNIDLMSFCALFPAIMGTLACLIIYFVGKDIGGASIGLLSALFLALSPSYIQRTSIGFFDDETIGIVALLLFMYMFLKSLEDDRPLNSTMKYAIGSGLALGYFISGWGAAFYPIGLTALFVLVLIVLKRYSQRLLLSYTVTFGLGLFIAINVPYLSVGYLTASAIIPVAGVFLLLCVAEILRNIASTRLRLIFTVVFICALIVGFAFLWQYGYLGSKFISVINPFARAESPLVESVAEHRISAWGSIYYEFGIGIIFFIVGLYFLVRKPTNKNLFIILFGITSLYFACSMVRLLVLMAPAFSLVATSGVVGVLRPFYTLLKEPPKPVAKKKYGLEHVGKEFSGTAIFLIFLILMTNFAFSPQSGGVPKVYRQAYTPTTISAGSLPVTPNEPVREWIDMLSWLRSNLGPKPIGEKVVCSWWDYGYWLSIIGNVTSLADNATINGTQIENIGFIFMANETDALKMLKLYDAKYILVFTTFYSVGISSGGTTFPAGTWAGYGDEGKWMWMARISGKAESRFKIGDTNGDGITDVNGLIDANSTWVDESKFGRYDNETNRWAWNAFGMQSTIYKLMAWGKHQWCEQQLGTGQDPEASKWSENGLTAEDIQPKYFEIAYFAGLDLTQAKSRSYSYIVPLVCLYKINWEKYYADYPNA